MGDQIGQANHREAYDTMTERESWTLEREYITQEREQDSDEGGSMSRSSCPSGAGGGQSARDDDAGTVKPADVRRLTRAGCKSRLPGAVSLPSHLPLQNGFHLRPLAALAGCKGILLQYVSRTSFSVA